MFFDRFDPSDVDPRHLVGRDRDQRWLGELLRRYLTLDGEPVGRAICISGEKGVGKSILTRKVLHTLRADHSSKTLFLTVDCRSCHERRGVLSAIANACARELDSLEKASVRLPDGLLASAQLLRAMSRYDDVELRVAHEQARQFRAAINLPGAHALLSALKLNFGLSLEVTDKQARSLTGSTRFDENGLCDALLALFRDIRECGLQVVLYLDNIDELRHDYRDVEVRERVRHDVAGLLRLKEAPIALILNMRKYYTGVVPREISNTRVLRPLAAQVLMQILELRLTKERPEVVEAFKRETVRAPTERLANQAPTALAFLRWVKFLFEEQLLSDDLREGFNYFLESYYSNVDPNTLTKVAAAFPTPSTPVDVAQLMSLCNGNVAVFEQLQDRQVILPLDFWNPTQYVLDPELHFLHGLGD